MSRNKLVANLEPGDIVGDAIVLYPPAEQQGCTAIVWLQPDGGTIKNLYIKPHACRVEGNDIDRVNRHLHPMPLYERSERAGITSAYEEMQKKKALADHKRALTRKANRDAAETRREQLSKKGSKGAAARQARREKQT
jgi:hypothetical protein